MTESADRAGHPALDNKNIVVHNLVRFQSGDRTQMMTWAKLLSTKRLKELYDEKPSERLPGDPRDEFERDYGRTVFSTPVRRLQDKAQVFPLEQHDAIRTRLTHSLEVSSVARSMGKDAERIVAEKEGSNVIPNGTIATIAATCGLVHDLGNPPFGHAGEKAIAHWFAQKRRSDPDFSAAFGELGTAPIEGSQFAMDFLKFEGNAQTQRLLSRLQVLADNYGLDLTCGTLSASCKYTAKSNTTTSSDQAKKKHGFFASENEMIERIRQEVQSGDARNPITFLVRLPLRRTFQRLHF